MSRFGRLAPPPQSPRPPTDLPVKVYPSVKAPIAQSGVSRNRIPAPPLQATVFQSLCFKALCIYLLSGYINDITLRLFHNKAYLSTVTVFIVPLVFVLTGTISRGLRHPIGKFWVAFAVCVALSLPFSIWRSGTLSLLVNYYPKSYMLYFYLCGCIVSVRQLRSMMTVLLTGAYSVLFVCFAFGSSENGRFSIPGSIFFENANELGLQLLLNITFFLYVFFTNRHILWKIISFAGTGLSIQYMLKTGSRGEFLGFLIVVLTTFLFSKRKLIFVAAAVPVICLSLFVVPKETMHRLTYIFMGASEVVASNMSDLSSRDSQLERQKLFWDSIAYSFQYPLFGVGAGQFAVRVAGDKEKRGERPEWLGTHNTYTQVSSETGLPAFVFYTLAITLCVRVNYVLFRRTAGQPEFQEYYAIAFCMCLCSIAYAFSTCFFHIAYSSYFPLIAGISVANYLTVKPLLAD